jgi:predicted branched-subunit amino acid permease
MSTIVRDRSFRDGARATLPVLVGIVPTGLALGAGLTAAGFPLGPGVVSSALVYGATSQAVLADVSRQGAPAVLTMAVVALASVRLLFYGAGLGRSFCGAGPRFRWLAPLLIVQPVQAVVDARFARPSTLAQRTAFFLGSGWTLWCAWQVSYVAGAVVGAVVPSALALDAALPLCLLALMAPSLSGRAPRAAAVIAAAAAVVLSGLPYGMGVALAAALGIGVGTRVR